MSEETIKITAIIRTDIRNPFSNLIFRTDFLGAVKHTRKSILSWFSTKKQNGDMYLVISAQEILTVHSLQEIYWRKIEISEIELFAESSSEYEVDISQNNFHFKMPATTTVAILKTPRAKISSITPKKNTNQDLFYVMNFEFGKGSSLVSY